jgi:hypothetical protein
MPFSQLIGVFISDCFKFEKGLIKDIFDALENIEHVEKNEDHDFIDNQSIFVKLICDIIFQVSSLGDQRVA